MEESSKPARLGIDGVFYSLAHVPELVRYGSKPAREIKVRPELEDELGKRLRSFSAATAYATHQVVIDNLTRFSFLKYFLTQGPSLCVCVPMLSRLRYLAWDSSDVLCLSRSAGSGNWHLTSGGLGSRRPEKCFGASTTRFGD
jgi:hypothetical protein